MDAALTDAWTRLRAEAARLCGVPLRALVDDPDRLARLRLSAAGLTLDLAKERLDAAALQALFRLAAAADLDPWRQRLLAGDPVNMTEFRPAFHVALRAPAGHLAAVDAARARTRDFARSAPDRAETILHIGIGGSDLGPRLVYEALKPMRRQDLSLRFAANIDGAEIADALEGLDPRRTLVVAVSKTFNTLETLANAEIARAWLSDALGPEAARARFAAVTAAPKRAIAWGVEERWVFPFWDWVGGRYSLWSAVSLAVEASLAPGVFERLLQGAAAMDAHFAQAPWDQNLPVMSALAHVWNRAALGAPGAATLPYAARLALLPAYLQQLEMESNGKGVDRDGAPLDGPAAGITWGAAGAGCQHSFMQALHQGRMVIPAEFVLVRRGEGDPANHRALNANALAQSEALMRGLTQEAAEAELLAAGESAETARALAPHKAFPGDRPSTILALDALSPETLGALLAFYEHRTFVQGVVHGVNSFDQWGVELGKRLARPIAAELAGAPLTDHDPATRAWIEDLRA